MAGVRKAATKKVVAKTRPAEKKVSRFPTLTTDVKAAVVAEVPPVRNGGVERSLRYARVLKDIREQVGVGQPVIVAAFVGPGGAAEVKRALERGDRPVDGKVEDWRFDARKHDGGRGSTLFATLLR